MIFKTNGNAGIGTGMTNPGSTLDVAGWIQATTPNFSTTGGVRIRGGAGDNPSYLQFTNNAGTQEWGFVSADANGWMKIRPWSGRMAIGDLPGNPTDMVHVAGNVRASGFVYTSDRTYKKNIKLIQNPLEKIIAMRGVTFSWKDGSGDDVGLIAQEVKKVEPLLVKGEEGDLSVKYGNVVAIIIEAMKDMWTKLSLYMQKQDRLENEVRELKELVKIQQQQLMKLQQQPKYDSRAR